MSNKHHSRRTILKRIMIVIGLILLALILILGTRLLLLRRDVGQYRQYWRAQTERPAPNNALTYIALGDSAAQGIGASTPEKGYVGLIAKAQGQKTGRPIHVINTSVTGATVQDTIDVQLPTLKKLDLPNDAIITLDIGSNNIRHYDQAAFAEQIDELFRQLPKQTVVADIPYFGGGRANNGEKAALMASQDIKKLAKKHGLRMAELHKATQEGNSFSTYAADFFHPNDKGYRNWFNAYWQILKD